MTVAVLGAAGTIGPAIVRDLAESDEVGAVVALDLDAGRAEAVAAAHGAGKARAGAVDATDPAALAAALAGVAVLVNAASYRINLAAMEAALQAGCHYVDLGGLYHVTTQQLARDAAFAAADRLAVLGAGAGPGKTNLMALLGAQELDRVAEVRCASAGLDEDPPPGASFPYALATLVDEITVPPMVVRGGEAVAVEPLSDGGEIDFPDPIGRRPSIRTLHSEVLTLPGSLGAREADFRLSLGPGRARPAAGAARVLAGGARGVAAGAAVGPDLVGAARARARPVRGGRRDLAHAAARGLGAGRRRGLHRLGGRGDRAPAAARRHRRPRRPPARAVPAARTRSSPSSSGSGRPSWSAARAEAQAPSTLRRRFSW